VIVVGGPIPACTQAGRFAVRGRRGINQIRFFGRIRGRELAEGVYVLTIRPRSGPQRRVAVSVAEDGARALSPTESSAAVDVCTTAPALAVARTTRSLAVADDVPAAQQAATPAPRPASKPPVEEEDPFSVVLPELGSVTPDASLLPTALEIAALAILALSALGVVFYLIRFLRTGEL
jgi:hypothetical protein